MMNDPLFYVELTGNKKANENMYWYKDSEENGNVKSIDDLKNIETTFNFYNYYGKFKKGISINGLPKGGT